MGPGVGRPPFQSGMTGLQNTTSLMSNYQSRPSVYPPLIPATMPNGASSSIGAHAADVEEEIPQVNSMQELYVLLSAQMNNLGNRMSTLENLMTNRLSVAENRLKLHDEELARKDEQIAHLTNTITNMQRSLNSIDSEKRSCNLIIAGMTEGQLTTEELSIDTDDDKVNMILSAIGLEQNQLGDNLKLARIGKQNENGRPRLLQVICDSNEIREKYW